MSESPNSPALSNVEDKLDQLTSILKYVEVKKNKRPYKHLVRKYKQKIANQIQHLKSLNPVLVRRVLKGDVGTAGVGDTQCMNV